MEQPPINAYVILSELAGGQFVSGAALGEKLSITRAAVWKEVQTLLGWGLQIDAVSGKGYRLREAIELYRYDTISSALNTEVKNQIARFDIFPVIPSTNSFIKSKLNSNGGGHGHVCLAEHQTEGRGRRGRQWVSPFAGNIYLSLCWRFAGGLDSLVGLSTALAVILADTLSDFGAPDIQVKWPNDIVHDENKIAGILIEAQGESAGDCFAIVGFGVNVRMPDDIEIDQQWTDMEKLLRRPVSRNQLVAAILNNAIDGLNQFTQQGIKPYLQRWRELDRLYGQPVQVSSHHATEHGVARGIDDYGALWLETEQGRKRFLSADVSVRKAACTY